MACEHTCCSTTGCGPGMCGQYLFSRVWINRGTNPARRQLNREKCHFPFPRLRLRIWSSETGSAVPSCAACLFSMLRLNLGLTHGIPPDFRDNTHIIYQPPLGFSPKFIGSRNCVPMAFTVESPLAQGQYSPRQYQERVLPFQVSLWADFWCASLFPPSGRDQGRGDGGKQPPESQPGDFAVRHAVR